MTQLSPETQHLANSKHSIRWYWDPANDGNMVPKPAAGKNSSRHVGHDARCSCGWQSRIGGGTAAAVKREIYDHKREVRRAIAEMNEAIDEVIEDYGSPRLEQLAEQEPRLRWVAIYEGPLDDDATQVVWARDTEHEAMGAARIYAHGRKITHLFKETEEQAERAKERAARYHDHVANGGGICGTCGSPAEATADNEGYSSCCNDRIEYGGEADETIARCQKDGSLSW